MKKILAACLSLVMVCSLMTACGDKDESKDEKDSSSVSDVNSGNETFKPDTNVSLSGNADAPLGETVGDEVEADTAPFDAITELDMTGAFTFDIYAVASSEGMSMEMPILVTSDGTNSYMEASVLGFKTVSLSLDGNTYSINHENKVYCVEEGESESGSDMISDSFDMSAFSQASENISSAVKVTLNDKEYTRYAVTIEDDDVFAYAMNGQLCYMADDEMVMIINEISTNAKTDKFVLPEGYTEVSAEEYYNIMMGLDGEDEEESEEVTEE